MIPWKTTDILECLMQEPLYSFYEIKPHFSNEFSFRFLLANRSCDDIITLINCFEDIWQESPALQSICKEELTKAAANHLDSIDASNYSYEVGTAISRMTHRAYDGDIYVNEAQAASELEELIEADAKDELKSKMQELPEILRISDQDIDDMDASVSGAEEVIDEYLSIDDDDQYEEVKLARDEEDFEIDCIFDR